MLPLLPFVAGLVTGAVTIKLWRNDKTSQTLGNAKVKTAETIENARTRLRKATVNGLSRLESSSAAMREKLSVVEATPETATLEEMAAAPVAEKTSRPRKAVAATGNKRPKAAKAAVEPVAGDLE